MTSKKLFYHRLQTFAEKTAVKAGQLLLKEKQQATIKKHKLGEDFATSADYASEKLIISEISKHFPKHNIVSEEIGTINNDSEYTWVIDPLDGTKEYFVGIPFYSVLLSCQDKHHLLVGCCFTPETGELYSASLGNGAFQDKTPLHVSSKEKLSRAIVVSHPPNSFVSNDQFSLAWKTIINVAKNTYRLRPSHWDAQFVCWLAKGAVDAYFITHSAGPRWYDIASGLTIAQEAGAKVTDKHGKPLKVGSIENGFVVSNGLIHDELLKIINQETSYGRWL